MKDDDLDLKTRAGLPDALRVLVKDYPRTGWETHPEFTGLVQFWMERHMEFRRLTAILQADAEAMLDRRLDAQDYATRLSRFGGMLLNSLHGHHHIEDDHYFPLLMGLDARITPGFDILETDHQVLNATLDRFAGSANAVLQADGDGVAHDAAGQFQRDLGGLARLLDRHLNDEEELVVPVILHTGSGNLGA